jgi:AraC-like DNA-binding protein
MPENVPCRECRASIVWSSANSIHAASTAARERKLPDGNDISPSVQVVSIVDPDQLAAALRDTQVEYLRLGPEPFLATLTAIELGPVTLQMASDHAHITRGHIAHGRSAMLLGLELAEDSARVNGVQMRQRDIMHLGPGAPILASVLEPIVWGALSFRVDALQAALPAASLPREQGFLLRQDGNGHPALAAFLREASILAKRDPARLGLSSVRRSMAEDALRLCVAAAGQPPRMDAAFRAVQRRIALVRQAEDLLAARIAEPIYSEDVQQALGVPMRTLHNAFVAVHGMSIHRYLRLRRMHQARVALRTGDGSISLVKIAALSHGFWHLGRFALEYRALFGELPSETMHRRHGTLLGPG